MDSFAMFETIDGDPVAINVDNVTYIRPRIDGEGTLIAFPGDDGVGVKGSLAEVLATLKAGASSEKNG